MSIFDVNSRVYSRRELEVMSSSELQRVFIWITFDKCFREKVKDKYPEYNFSPIKYSDEFMAMEDRILERDQFIDVYLKYIGEFKNWRIRKIHELKEAIQIEQGSHYNRSHESHSYEFHYSHKEHADLCARLAGLLGNFLQ